MSDSSSSRSVFNNYVNHNGTPRTSTELMLLDSIRAAYSSQHVTLTDPKAVDLRGYAEAGLAQLIPGSINYSDTTRSYKAPPNRLSGLLGTLKDNARFATFSYVFNESTFVAFEIEYTEPLQLFMKGPVKLLYIVAPKADEGPTMQTSEVTDDLLLAVGSWSNNLHNEIYVFDSSQWTKDKTLFDSVQASTFSSVILSPDLKKTLMADITTFFSARSTYTRLSVPWKRGLLFHGFPGNGKTISIRAIINVLANLKDPVPSLVVKSFDSMQGPKFSIREIFQKARSMAPCLLVFEDLDSLITNKTRSYFLNEVDGLECNDGILMIGTTNHLDLLDPAISKRPSRFDRKYHFKLPEEAERLLYCEFWRSKLRESSDGKEEFGKEACGIVAKLTEGFSFAYMKELFVISLLTIARGEGDEVTAEEPTAVKENKSDEQRNKRAVPEVVIPQHLKDNVLLNMLRRQCQALLDEMDNTAADEWIGSSSKTGKGGEGGGFDFAAAMKMARGEGDSCS